jgi:putative phosphoserine phosphatase/1-acylglycerol-3-phosphate O-acyltransferase
MHDPPRAAFFDLERTITRHAVEQVATAAAWRRGAARATDVVRVAVLYGRYYLGLLDDYSGLKRAGAKLFAGRDHAKDVALYNEIYQDQLHADVFPEAAERIHAFQAEGVRCVIVSATYRFMVAPFARDLGIEEFTGQELEIVDGICTGRLEEPIYHREEKALVVREIAEKHGLDLADSWAFGDSLNDQFMLEAVGHGVVVNPGRKLQALAIARGWSIARWGG